MGQILGQYCINVADLERAIGFWDGICGIPLRSRTEIPGVLEAVLMADEGGSRLQLAQHLDRPGPVDMGTAMWKLYINTSDCQTIYDKAVAAGCESVRPPELLERWNVKVAFIKDFDGYLIEFVEYYGDTPPGVPKPTK